MEQAIIKLPDVEHPTINGNPVDLSEVVSLRIEGNDVIPYYAFTELQALKYVEIADDVLGIKSSAFEKCFSLEQVIFGKSIQYIGDSAFVFCNSLLSVDIPGNVKTIAHHAFFSCDNLVSVIIHEGTEYIGGTAFGNCKKLCDIHLPDSIKAVGGNAFDRTKWLNEQTQDFAIAGKTLIHYLGKEVNNIQVPEGVKTICDSAFWPRLFYQITFPSSLRYIGFETFRGNGWLTEVTLPDGLLEIGDYAFADCWNLKTVHVPKSVVHIGLRAIKPEHIPDAPKTGCVVAGQVAMACNGNQKKVIIPEGVYSISKYAFYQKYKLEEVVLPTSLHEIDTEAFFCCTHLKSLKHPISGEEISLDSFKKETYYL